MKHHIKSKILKDFKKFLWFYKLRPINFKFIVDGNIESEFTNIEFVNYGMIQTDGEGHVISSNDSSYNYHYRRLAEKDEYEYYQFLLCLKHTPAKKYYIINRDLSLDVNEEKHLAKLTWTSLNGNKKEIIFEGVVD